MYNVSNERQEIRLAFKKLHMETSLFHCINVPSFDLCPLVNRAKIWTSESKEWKHLRSKTINIYGSGKTTVHIFNNYSNSISRYFFPYL